MDSMCFPFVILCVFFFIVKLTSFTKLSVVSVRLILWAILVFILYLLYMVVLNLLRNSLGVSHVHYLPTLTDTQEGWISTEGFSFLKPTFVSCSSDLWIQLLTGHFSFDYPGKSLTAPLVS